MVEAGDPGGNIPMTIDKLVRCAAGLGLVGAMFFACTGDLNFDPGNPGPDAPPVDPEPANAKEYFDQKVASFVQPECGCHTTQAPVFVGANYDATYTYLKEGYPDTGLIRSTYQESSFYTVAQVDHKGVTWDENQSNYIKEWINREYEEYNPQLSPARQRFDAYVFPLLAKCGGCHGNTAPAFAKATADDAYAFLKTGYPSPLVNTTAEQSTLYIEAYPNEHYGLTWAAGEATAIKDWIDEEYAEYSAQ
jgi:hypothetical protein